MPGALAALLCGGALYAQQEPVIRLDVRQVIVPVIVTDKKGHHVTGLRQPDFRVVEDGVPQEIAAFSTDTSASVDDVNALSKSTVPQTGPRRTYVICIDTLHASPANAARVREALETFFRDEKGTDAQYVLIGIGRQLRVLQTATTSPLAVLLKVRDTAFQTATGGPEAAAFTAEINNLNTRMEQFCRGCACGVRTNLQSCDSQVENLKQSVDSEAGRWTALNDGMAAQFKSVVEELAKLPTGRTLMLISDGFNLNPKREFYAAIASWLPNSPQFRTEDVKDVPGPVEEALKLAAERNVIIYGIDSRGGYTPTLSSTGAMDASGSGGGREVQSVIGSRGETSVRSTSLHSAPGAGSASLAPVPSAAMEHLANATGGVYFHDSKDLLKQFRDALADGREYYLLAYVPKDGSADGRYRRITVEVAGKNLNVRAKAGYWAGTSAQ